MIFDTDVLIWFLRGNVKAATVIEAAENRRISAVTLMELQQGVRDKKEQKAIGRFLNDQSFDVLMVSEIICHRACIYVEEYGLKSSVKLADALIAATAVEHRDILCTANGKHYKVISELELKIFKPE